MENQENLDTLNVEETYDVECNTKYLPEYIYEINVKALGDITLSKDSFQKGVNKMSKLCGMISALVNVGITPDMALSYLATKRANKDTINMSLKTTEMQTQATTQSAKYEFNAIQKNTI